MLDTDVVSATHGSVGVVFRDVSKPNYVLLAIGCAVEGELMATRGFAVNADSDTDEPGAPPEGRGWKHASAFVLVDDDEVLACTHGGMRLELLDWYLRMLLSKANRPAAEQAFGLVARTNRDRVRTLEAEGVSSLKLGSTAYAVSAVLEDEPIATGSNWLEKGWNAFLRGVKEAFEAEATNDAEREAILAHLADLNVSATVNVRGGRTKGDPTLVKSLKEVATDAIEDAPEGTEVTIITGKNNPVTASALVISKVQSVRRLHRQNELDHLDAWEKLENYRVELAGEQRWKA